MIFGGTLALAEIWKRKLDFYGAQHKVCDMCRSDVSWEFDNWLTDQAIRGGLKASRSSSDAGVGAGG